MWEQRDLEFIFFFFSFLPSYKTKKKSTVEIENVKQVVAAKVQSVYNSFFENTVDAREHMQFFIQLFILGEYKMLVIWRVCVCLFKRLPSLCRMRPIHW